ncbi:MAG TPA: hypothetical protein VK550_24195, partial [Polyangiaceae bacterium]|nr:hypothetical protein [Polyangiaceae bacterium]
MIGDNMQSSAVRWALRTWITSVAIGGSLLSASTAYAQRDDPHGTGGERVAGGRSAPTSVAGTVLDIDEEDIVLDLGSAKGAVDGSVIELWRPFKLRHPVTGQSLTDRFRIGSLRLVQVQKTLAWARPEGALARAPAAGDVVVMPRARPVEPHGTPPKGPALSDAPPSEPVTAEAKELSLLFDALKGQAIADRIARYEQYLRAHPNGAYARVLSEEADALRQLLGAGRSAGAATDVPHQLVTFRPPSSALAHEPLTIGAEMAPAAGAVLHVRHAGEMAYQTLAMRPAGARYFRATIDPAQMQAPEVEYFVEAVTAGGLAVAAIGTADTPQRIEVRETPRPLPPSRPAASASIFTDYADYNRLRGNDYAWQTEGQFGLRYADQGVRAVRSGFGVYRGLGGSVFELDSIG